MRLFTADSDPDEHMLEAKLRRVPPLIELISLSSSPKSKMGSNELPAAVDAQSPLSASELQVLRSQFESESSKGWVSVQTKFNLAWGCVKSNDKAEVAEGISILMEIYRTDPPRRRECLYFLAVGHYKLGSFDSAKKYTGEF